MTKAKHCPWCEQCSVFSKVENTERHIRQHGTLMFQQSKRGLPKAEGQAECPSYRTGETFAYFSEGFFYAEETMEEAKSGPKRSHISSPTTRASYRFSENKTRIRQQVRRIR